MLLEIERAEYIKDYILKLYFNNGEIRIADLSASLNGQIFEPLKDLAFFKKFEIKFNTIEWENGADFAPEYLYEISSPIPFDYDNQTVSMVADSGSDDNLRYLR